MKLGALSLMPHCVEGIVDATRQRLITYINCIATSLLEARLIGSNAIGLTAGCSRHACCTSHKGILLVVIYTFVPCKTSLWRCHPVFAHLNFKVVALRTIIIYDDFFFLPVALTRREDDSSSILQHRNEVGHHDGLCKRDLSAFIERRLGINSSIVIPFVITVS